MKRFYRFAFFAVFSFSFLLSGCKIQIDVPNGAAVKTISGKYYCGAGQRCIIELVDLFFDETFIAEPEPGYFFLGWEKLDHGLCAFRSGSCPIKSSHAEGVPALMSILESDETFYLRPHIAKGTHLADALQRVTDENLRECIRTWSSNETLTYAEEVTDIRCIDDEETIETAEGLQGFPGLRTLMLNAWKYDLSPLTDLVFLDLLRLRVHPDVDLSPLANLIRIERLEFGVFQPESNCDQYINTKWQCQGEGIKGFGVLAGMTKMGLLNIYMQVPNLEPLAKMKRAHSLHLSRTGVSDLTPLNGLKKVERLYLTGNKVEDTTPLSGMRSLKFLFLSDNQVRNLKGLEGLRIHGVSLSDNEIVDISPLRKLVPPGPPPNDRLTLYLRNNNIRRIGNAFDAILKGEIYLDGNPLPCSEIDSYLERKPPEVTLDYSGCN
jgi:hypothetical protein